MLLSLLLSLVWAGGWALGADQPIATECKDSNQRYKAEIQELVTVQEGLCVLVPCKFMNLYYANIYSSWFRTGANPYQDSPVATNNLERPVQKATEGRFYILRSLQVKNCSLDIRDARKSDNGSYFIHAEIGRIKMNFCKNPVSVHVTALTHTPHIDIPWILEPGHPSNLTCSVPWACERGTPPIFSWMSSAFTSLGPRTTFSSTLSLTPRPQDHGTNLTCQVNFPGAGVTVEKTIQLNVSYAPKKLTIEVYRRESTGPEVLCGNSSLQIQEGDSLNLVCVADSNPPATVSWEKLTFKHIQVSIHEVLLLSPVELKDQGNYTCRAQHSLGTQEATVSLVVRTEKPEAEPRMVQRVLGGTGITVLLAVCLCVICFMLKIYRRKSAERAASRNGTHPVKSTVSLVDDGPQNGPEDHPPPGVSTPISGEEPELHYASFSFQERQDTSSLYSEVKAYKL